MSVSLAGTALIIAVVLLAFGCQKADEPQQKIVEALTELKEGSGEINSKAPAFELEDTNGRSTSIAEFAGKAVYINFFTTWCPICNEEQAELNRASAATDVQFIGISMREDGKAVSEYAKRHNTTYPLLLDTNGEVSRKYFTTGQPVHFFIDTNGIIRDRATGPLSYERLIKKLERIGAAAAAPAAVEAEKITITGGVKHAIPLEDIVEVLPTDRIPAIDNPKFVAASDADAWLGPEETVLGMALQGEARAYPVQIMTWHEIVNDEMQGKPVAVTFCPLCDTGIGFERRVNGEPDTFGTSGKLYNNNLLMYDRKTKTLWNQLTGKAVVGELAGYSLAVVPVETTTWQRWKKLHPDTKVLSRETGHPRPYGVDPYAGYKNTEDVLFPVAAKDDRLFGKARVQGIEIEGQYKAYDEASVIKEGPVNDELGGRSLLVVADPDTLAVKIFDRKIRKNALEFSFRDGKLTDSSGGEWKLNGPALKALTGALSGSELQQLPSIGAFWFSWVAQHPETGLWKENPENP